MFLLNKVFQLRDKANPDLEKPFLEHLDDLRIMITRIVVTLLISMIVCFAFQDKLMDLLREPVDQVTQIHASKLLPADITPANWEAAKKVEHAAITLGPERIGMLLEQFDAETLRRVELVRLLRAIAVLPEANRSAFLQKAASPENAAIVTEMLAKGASPEIDIRGNLQLMSALKPT